MWLKKLPEKFVIGDLNTFKKTMKEQLEMVSADKNFRLFMIYLGMI